MTSRRARQSLAVAVTFLSFGSRYVSVESTSGSVIQTRKDDDAIAVSAFLYTQSDSLPVVSLREQRASFVRGVNVWDQQRRRS